ncbi:MAG: hypothetical protein ACFFCS_11045 [Candidatus Hodarchaeota archaeon]
MPALTCPNCAADLNVPAGSPIYTCEYCGTAIQIAGKIEGDTSEGEQSIIKDHFIIRAKYGPEQADELLIDWVKKIPGAPQDFEASANIHTRKLKFYPLWVSEHAATSEYVGIDDWPQFSNPAHDRAGWYEHVSYYPKEESGNIVREYQIPLMALDVEKLPKYLRTYIVTTTGKEYFDINHVKKLGGEIIDSVYTYDEAKSKSHQAVMDRQTAEMHKEVKKITQRSDNIQQRGLYYIHFPLYEYLFNYNGKEHDALIDGSSGRVVHVKVPVSKEFRAKTMMAAAIHWALGVVCLLLGIFLMSIFGLVAGIGLLIVGFMFFGLNLRGKASEKQT